MRFIVLAIVSLMVTLDATILTPVLPVGALNAWPERYTENKHFQVIASDLRGNMIDTFWTGAAYLLTQPVLQPFLVSLSDGFGRHLFYLISFGFSTIGTLLCCLSQNSHHLFAGCTIQGVGGGGILALGLVILTDIVPLRQRPMYRSVNQMS